MYDAVILLGAYYLKLVKECLALKKHFASLNCKLIYHIFKFAPSVFLMLTLLDCHVRFIIICKMLTVTL